MKKDCVLPSIENVVIQHRINTSLYHTYDVFMTANSQEACYEVVRKLIGNRRRLLVTSQTVFQIYGEEFFRSLIDGDSREHLLVLNCSESTKNVDQVLRICQQAQEVGLDRQGVLVALEVGSARILSLLRLHGCIEASTTFEYRLR